MRWFKHMTDSRSDEKMVELISIAGMEGYGFYWAIIELIGKKLEKDSTICTVTYPLTYLSRQLYLHHNKVSNLLGKLQVTGLVMVDKIESKDGVKFSLTAPNLLKYRDEYHRKRKNIRTNSGQTPEQDTDTDIDTDTDTEVDDGKKILSSSPPTKTPTSDKVIFDKLSKALGKLQPSPEEVEICKQLFEVGCSYEDIEAARLQKNKNSLKYLRNIVCEQRDKRLNKSEEFDAMDFLRSL